MAHFKFNFCKEVYDKIMKDTILNKKEKDCFKYLVQGYTCKYIADKLRVSERTVKNRRKSIFEKLNLNITTIDNSKFCVYILVFPNKKFYIGKAANPKQRWNNGEGYRDNQEMYTDIQKFGWDNIEKKILYRGLTELEAHQKENETIVIYKSYMTEYGYNKSITN